MKTKTLHQTVDLPVSPHDVYEALMDSKQHSEFTGDEARISRNVGEPFSAFSEWASGVNKEIIPDKKIVQTWRGEDWPEGHYSLVTYELKKTATGTVLEFTQTGIPEELFEEISEGWIDNYWDPLKEYLTQK